MRLRAVREGQRGSPRFLLATMRRVTRAEPPDIVKTLLYRSGFFGRTASELTQQAMRGPSTWSVGERELFAAYTSRLNQCPY